MAALSSQVSFYLYLILSGLFIAVAVALWRIGQALRRRHDRRHEVLDPAGRQWSTRLHWGRPHAGFGLGARLFPRRLVADPEPSNGPESSAGKAPEPTRSEGAQSKKKQSRFDWLDGLEIFDEGLLIVLGLILLIGLVVTGALVVLLAIELVVVAVAALAFAVARGFFGHPWVIEVAEPLVEPPQDLQAGAAFGTHYVAVRGLRAAFEAHEEIRAGIASAGSFTRPQHLASDRPTHS